LETGYGKLIVILIFIVLIHHRVFDRHEMQVAFKYSFLLQEESCDVETVREDVKDELTTEGSELCQAR
jgi:hypothetical protein